MRSFAEYRKAQLKDVIRQSCLQEGLEKQFEILRLDLLEAIRLPNNFQSNILAEVQYNHARQADYVENRYLVEQILQVCKEEFYHELLAEAQAQVDVGTSLQQLRDELIRRIKAFIQEMRDVIGGATGGTRDLSQDAGVDASASAGGGAPGAPGAPRAPGAPQAPRSPSPGAPGRQPSTPGGSPYGSIYADPSGVYDGGEEGRNDYPRWRDYRGQVRPQQGGGHQPAPYGSMVPSDGLRGGLSRLWRRITRPIRRIWHGDASREMAKEHVEFLETVFTENSDQIKAVIDRFEADIIPFITKRIDQIVRSVLPGAGAAAGAAGAAGAAPGKMAVGTAEESPVGDGTPSGEAEADAEAKSDAARDLALNRGAPPEQAEAEAEQAKHFALEELARDGATKLAIDFILPPPRPKAHDIKFNRANLNFVDKRTGKKIEGTPAKIYDFLIHRAYEVMYERAAEKYPDEAFLAGRKGLRKGNNAIRRKSVEAALGIKLKAAGGGGHIDAILALLSAVEKHFSGRVATPKPQADPTVAATGSAKPVVPGTNPAQKKTGALPVGSADPGLSQAGGKVTADALKLEAQKRHPKLYGLASGETSSKNLEGVFELAANKATDMEHALKRLSGLVLKHLPEDAAKQGWDGSELAAVPGKQPSLTGATGATGMGSPAEKAAGQDPALQQAGQAGFDPVAALQQKLAETKSKAEVIAAALGVEADELTAAMEQVPLGAVLKEKGVDPATLTSEKQVDDLVMNTWFARVIRKLKDFAEEEAEAAGEEAGEGVPDETGASPDEPAPAAAEEPEPVEDTRPFNSLPPEEQQAMLRAVNVTPEEAAQIQDGWTVDDVKAWLDILPKRRAGTSEVVPDSIKADAGVLNQGVGDEDNPDNYDADDAALDTDLEQPEEDEVGQESGAEDIVDDDYLDAEGNVIDDDSAFASLKRKYPGVATAAASLADAIQIRQEINSDFNISDLGYGSLGDIYHTAKLFADASGKKAATKFLQDLLKDFRLMMTDDDHQAGANDRIEMDDEDDGWEDVDAERDDNKMRRENFSETINRLRKKLLHS